MEPGSPYTLSPSPTPYQREWPSGDSEPGRSSNTMATPETEEKEMEMRAEEGITIGQDMTPPVPPLSFSLYDTFLLSNCSSCFCPIPISPPSRHSSTTAVANSSSPFIGYCSSKCASSDTPLHLSSAEHNLFLLLQSIPSVWSHGDSSELRASLRLLRRLELYFLLPNLSSLPRRIAGLITNRGKLTSSIEKQQADENFVRIADGARVMAMARAMRDDKAFDGDCDLEMDVLCAVLTNSVEVQVHGERALGIGVYDRCVSWINHSCSPNSFYRFEIFSEALKSSDHGRLRMVPAGDGIEGKDSAVCSICEMAKGCDNYGPRLIVRSIKEIEKGEEVTVTYIDLLQPTTLRRSELWQKYQFFCSCGRCSVVPQSYVDYALQETFSSNQYPPNATVVNEDKAMTMRKLQDDINDIIAEYMSDGDPEVCCRKLEKLLTQGFTGEIQPTNGSSHVNFWLSPLHHLSLNAYTTLYSIYRICAAQEISEKQEFDRMRISGAYCFLLAGATHHLFISDPSLIASAAAYWKNAGECILCLTRNSYWRLLVKQESLKVLSFLNHKCSHCSLMDKFEANFICSQSQNNKLDSISQQFLKCVSMISEKVWGFLVRGCVYLHSIKDPLDFSWLGALRSSSVWEMNSHFNSDQLFTSPETVVDYSTYNCQKSIEERINTFQLGLHCWIYGIYLSSICYGHRFRTTQDIRGMLCG